MGEERGGRPWPGPCPGDGDNDNDDVTAPSSFQDLIFPSQVGNQRRNPSG